ncbi:MAG: hypothetical protein ACPIOQ_38835 [Promethearchaeia archaeon]
MEGPGAREKHEEQEGIPSKEGIVKKGEAGALSMGKEGDRGGR